METKQIDVRDIPLHLSEVLDWVRHGTEVLLMENNQPIARLAPVVEAKPLRVPGLHKGALRIHDDFDAPLPDAFWEGE